MANKKKDRGTPVRAQGPVERAFFAYVNASTDLGGVEENGEDAVALMEAQDKQGDAGVLFAERLERALKEIGEGTGANTYDDLRNIIERLKSDGR